MSGGTQPSKFSAAWIHTPHTLGLERLIRKSTTLFLSFAFIIMSLILVAALFHIW